MIKNNKKVLYESIMQAVSKTVKKRLFESDDINELDDNEILNMVDPAYIIDDEYCGKIIDLDHHINDLPKVIIDKLIYDIIDHEDSEIAFDKDMFDILFDIDDDDNILLKSMYYSLLILRGDIENKGVPCWSHGLASHDYDVPDDPDEFNTDSSDIIPVSLYISDTDYLFTPVYKITDNKIEDYLAKSSLWSNFSEEYVEYLEETCHDYDEDYYYYED